LLGVLLLSAPDLLLAQVASRPNIVVIMTDDQRLDKMRVMSKARSLIGDRGTTFTNYFAAQPWCCPSRATYLTGQYPHNHGVYSNNPPTGGYTKLNHTNTLAVWLQKAGYFTSHIGKFMNGYGEDGTRTEIPVGWSDWQTVVAPAHRYYNYTINDNGQLVNYGQEPQDYMTDVLSRRAIDTLASMDGTAPFFLAIDVLAPHRETNPYEAGTNYPKPAPRHIGAF
jgi:arylsulfatase A-like enzyme